MFVEYFGFKYILYYKVLSKQVKTPDKCASLSKFNTYREVHEVSLTLYRLILSGNGLKYMIGRRFCLVKSMMVVMNICSPVISFLYICKINLSNMPVIYRPLSSPRINSFL